MRLPPVTTTLLFLAIPALAAAHGGNNDPNMVHACVGNASKVVRIVGVSGSCIASPPILAETAVHWPQVAASGPQGPKGDKGDKGDQGIPGPQGEHGTNGVDGAAGGTRAAGRCFGNDRYVNCGNGTVTDSLNGLIWLRQADCLPDGDYVAANLSAAALKSGECGLTDGSSPGDWRLPTGEEWAVMVARAVTMGCSAANGTGPSLTNDFGLNCWSTGPSSFVGVTTGIYSGSSTYEGHMGRLIAAFLGSGFVGDSGKGNVLKVWPVRGGTR